MTKVLDQSTGLENKHARLLAALLKKKHIERPQTTPIPRRAVHSPCVLSFAQQRLWLLDQLSPGSAAYNIPLNIRLTGHLNQAALELTISKILRRHEVLRTRFEEFEGEPRQVIASSSEVLLEKVDLSGWQGAEQEKEVRERALQEAQIPFDLAQGPLLRVKLLRLGESEHVLLVAMHHIVSDGWSLGIMMREFGAVYRAYSKGEGSPLPELGLQYADYAVWQREWLGGGELQEQMGYWKEQLAGLETLELPTDHPRPAVMSHRGATIGMELGEELTGRISELSRREGVTLFMALLAGVQVLLGRYAGQQDVAVGTPIANRTRQEIEPLIGFFVNTLVLRGEVRSEWSFREMLKRVREVTLAAYAHQDVPFEHLVEDLQPVRDLSRNPLFQVMLSVQHVSQESFSLPGLSVEALGTEGGEVAKFDLTFAAAESANNIKIGINYATELYEPVTIERMGSHFRAVLEEMSRNADSRIGEVKIMSEAERAQVVEEWSRTGKEYEEKTILTLFEEQVKRTPKAMAVEYAGEQLEYQELNRRSNQLGHYLRNLGVEPEVRVALCLERSLEMVVAIMAVLKAGGAYVPLDPAYPPERLGYMLKESQSPVLLTQEKLRGQLPSNWVQAVSIDGEWDLIAAETPENLEQQAEMENLAYVIYTSGSTGRPKGVGITHRGLANYLRWALDAYRIHATGQLSVAPVHSPLGFDLTVTSIFPALLAGKCISLLAPGDEINALAKGLQVENAYSVLKLTPSHLKLLSALLHGAETIAGADALIIGGEDLNYQDLSLWLEHSSEIRLVNEYGPTETVVGCCVYEVNHCGAMDGGVPIGKPIANTQLYVLDEDMQPVPIRVAGELYIGGAGVARGYLNRPDLTGARFVPNPFVSSRQATNRKEGERLYRTGDRVRWRGDGNLEYLGRLDEQVKIRGYRIELGEIEAALEEQAGVGQAVVVAREEGGDKHLVAYVVAERKAGEQKTELRWNDLREGLRKRLPEYMVPAAYMELEELPLTGSGKLDRKRLPQPGAGAMVWMGRGIEGGKYVGPRDVEEEMVCGIWEAVLKREGVGVEENFFELGGHSLLVTQVVARVREGFGVEMGLRVMFERPTVAGMVEEVKRLRSGQVEEEGSGGREGRAGRAETSRGEKRIKRRVERVEGRAEFPLSYAQQRLWFLEQMEPGNAVYNIPFALRVKGELDGEALKRSLAGMVKRHEVLRTVFVWNEEQEAVQRVVGVEESRVKLEEEELAGIEMEEREEEVRRLAEEEAGRGFDLSRGPLLRVKLVRIGEEEHVLLVTMHHIVSDGWSLGVLVREWLEMYEGERAGRDVELKELEVQYGDYAVWQREWLGGGELEKQMGYWREQLRGIETLELPADRVRPGQMSHRGGTVEVEIGEEITAGIREMSRKEGVTIFMTLLAGVQVLLARYSGQEAVVVGTPIANRGRREVEGLIGFFVNTLVLRGEVKKERSFREQLRDVREVMLGAYGHQDVPFERLVEELKPERDTNRTPLFQVMVAMENEPREEVRIGGLQIEGLRVEGVEGGSGEGESGEGVAKFDLTFGFSEEEGGEREGRRGGRRLGVGINYSMDLYEEGTIERMGEYLRGILWEVTRGRDCKVGEIRMMGEEERKEVVEVWNRTRRSYGEEETVVEIFEEQVRRNEQAVAVEYEGEQLSYAELNQQSNQLAHYLRRRLGVGLETRVGICMERSLEMVIAILSVLKAGAVYVPLDPDYPKERLQFMMSDCGAEVLLRQRGCTEEWSDLSDSVVELDREWPEIKEESSTKVVAQVGGENLAYIIYTSGSTGKPKGAGIPHRSLLNHMRWMQEEFQYGPEDRVLQKTSSSFDASVWEFFAPLLSGGQLVLLRAGAHRDPGYLLDQIFATDITVVQVVPTLLEALLQVETVKAANKKSSHLRLLLCGGEVLRTEAVNVVLTRWGVEVVNLYGPTEATIDASCWRSRGEWSEEKIPIGKPVANTKFYVLNEEMALAPVGVAGELYIGGSGLARGYVNRPELTAERFLPDPFVSETTAGGERLYRTGDRVRWRSDGNLEYLGRLDQQVKIRGYRIELGEIEAALQEQAGVAQAVVVVQEDESGDKRLVAYVVGEVKEEGSGQVELDGSKLRRQLRGRLPEYMVPSAFVVLQELPLNANGKLDRKRLPRAQAVEAGAQDRKPRTVEEEILCEIWEQVLGRGNISVSDNFFDIGGHSIKAVLLSARISRAFEKEISVRLIFDKPTIEEQASFVRGDASLNSPGSLVPIQRAGSRQPIFCVHPFFGLAHCYQELSSLLGPDQPFYGLQCYGLETDQTPLSTIPEMAKFYLQAIRTVQPHGPFQLAGWSMGALIAYELAGQLAAEGETVSFLGLFEGHVPQHPAQPFAPSRNEWEKLVDEREAENLRYMAKRGSTSEEEASDLLLQLGRYLAEFTQVPVGFSREQLTRLSRMIAINQLAVESYRPGSYSGNVSLFRVPGQADEERSYGWAELVHGELKIFEVPGTHDGFMSSPSVNVIASHLQCLLHAGSHHQKTTLNSCS